MAESKERFAKRLSQIYSQLDTLVDKEGFIQAKYTKSIWSDDAFEKWGYNQREKLRKAELTLKLSEDADYQDIRSRIRELKAERIELEELNTYGIDMEE